MRLWFTMRAWVYYTKQDVISTLVVGLPVNRPLVRGRRQGLNHRLVLQSHLSGPGHLSDQVFQKALQALHSETIKGDINVIGKQQSNWTKKLRFEWETGTNGHCNTVNPFYHLNLGSKLNTVKHVFFANFVFFSSKAKYS